MSRRLQYLLPLFFVIVNCFVDDLDDNVYASADTGGSSWQAKAQEEVQHENAERTRMQALVTKQRKAERDAHVWAEAQKARIKRMEGERARMEFEELKGESEKELPEFSNRLRSDGDSTLATELYSAGDPRTELNRSPRSLIRREDDYRVVSMDDFLQGRTLPEESDTDADDSGDTGVYGGSADGQDDTSLEAGTGAHAEQVDDDGSGVYAGGSKEDDTASTAPGYDGRDDAGSGIFGAQTDPTNPLNDAYNGGADALQISDHSSATSSPGTSGETNLESSEVQKLTDKVLDVEKLASKVLENGRVAGLGPRNANRDNKDANPLSKDSSFLEILGNGRSKASRKKAA